MLFMIDVLTPLARSVLLQRTLWNKGREGISGQVLGWDLPVRGVEYPHFAYRWSISVNDQAPGMHVLWIGKADVEINLRFVKP